MRKKLKLTLLVIVLSLSVAFIQPVCAGNNTDSMNVSISSDLDETLGNDTLELVNKSRLKVDGGPAMYIHWSPDGTRALVLTKLTVHAKNKPEATTRSEIRALYIMNADGFDIKRIAWGEYTPYTRKVGNDKLIGLPSWSPDGDVFTYTSEELAKNGNILGEFLIVDADNLNTIEKGSFISNKIDFIKKWSPDGSYLLYRGYKKGEGPKCYLLDLTRNITRRFPITQYNPEDITWSPKGNKIAFLGEEKGNESAFVYNLDNGNLKNIFSTKNSSIHNPLWSPDGRKLAFSKIEDNNVKDVYVIDINVVNGRPYKLTTLHGGILVEWLDSEKLLYTEYSPEDNLYSISVNSRNKTLLYNSTNESGIDYSYSDHSFVDPTGEFVFVEEQIGLNYKTHGYINKFTLMKTDGSDTKHWRINPQGFEWCGDDLLLEVVTENDTNKLVMVNASTKSESNISVNGSHIEKINWNPTGRYLFTRNQIMEVSGYGKPMRIDVDNELTTNSSVKISVERVSGSVGNATVYSNGEHIGRTNPEGVLSHQFKNNGSYRLKAVKVGYINASHKVSIGGKSIVDKVGSRIDNSVSDKNETDNPGLYGKLLFIVVLVGLTFLAFYGYLKFKK
ncbi:WD40 domain protein beta Propeller [Methanohalobium evestigatum Z-7303]|uniref:WD40 domain protein beta Propeller n=1 Tax=Methanohalobium evestigatum (strain ATCC BAA-1072 / DSM 3721 / NBRC 107634 / OCM 161 / Z-7303) TaxID=644295 RepID=D7E9R8_METEZ|nr:PD40 domain-containing protein [Methanohalobium evestigatum]ADI74340.1 WD40 domain protein beta Propeller [Methanohalobium evestigatum Z-7303]